MIRPGFEVKKKTPIAVVFAGLLLLVMLAAFSLPAAVFADRRASSRYSSLI